MRHTKPNILIITADQWRGDCLGYKQTAHPVMTPHLNQLAAEGVSFHQAYADCPVCMPQRATLLTGMTAAHMGINGNFSHRTPIEPSTSLPGMLSRLGGYQTKAIGKMHFNPDRARMGFEHVVLHPDDYVNWLEQTEYAGLYRGHGLGGNEVYPAVSAVPERLTHTHWMVDQGIDFLSQRDPENPFFLWMVFEAPHSPFDPPEPYDRMYDHFSIPDPISGDWVNDVDYPASFKARRLSNKYDHLSDQMIRAARRKYYGQISHIDYQLGRLFGELKSKKIYDDTLILFTSDHGEHLGDFGLFAKSTFLKGSADVPLIMKLPAATPSAHPALELDIPVLTADIYPTVLAIAGIDRAHAVDGISLLPWMQNVDLNRERTVCGEVGSGSSGTAFATDGRYKYIYYMDRGKEQLFDVKHDPDDTKNLIRISAYQREKENLKSKLIAYLSGYNRPMVKDGSFAMVISDDPAYELRGKNHCAWRGPLRHGQGYGGTG